MTELIPKISDIDILDSMLYRTESLVTKKMRSSIKQQKLN